MHAIALQNYGSSDQFIDVIVDQPAIKPNQVLIQNKAVAIDPYDVKFKTGVFGTKTSLPAILGSSVAGIITQIGSEVTDYFVGQRVVASPHLKTYAEYVAVSSKQLSPIPKNVSDEVAASLALGGQTGFQGITADLNLQPGETILIHGGAGSVGLSAIYAALIRDAQKIYTTASPIDFDFLQTIDSRIIPIDYHLDWATQIKPVDAVLDTIGAQTALDSLKVLKSGGRLRSTIAVDDLQAIAQQMNVDGTHYFLRSGETLSDLMNAVSDGKVIPRIAQSVPFTLENLKTLHELSEKGHPAGKLVLTF